VNAVDTLIRFVLETGHDDLPGTAREAALVFLADAIAVGIAGSAEPSAVTLRDVATGWGSGTEASVLGSKQRLPAASAAWVNSFQVHCQEFDPLHEGATVHAMAVLTGALLATAEREDSDGAALLEAVALGVEVAATLGLAATRGLEFFRPATAGTLGATLALAKLRGFEADTCRNALGFAYSQLAGTMQAHVEGSVALPLQIAHGARAVVTSLDLAAAGLTAPHDVLDGPFGYFSLYERDGSLDSVLPTLGSDWRITELSHKPFPTGRAAHAVLDAVAALGEEQEFGSRDIDTISARVPPLVCRLVARPAVAGMSSNYARLCLPFLLASLLRDGRIDTATFAPARLDDPELIAFNERLDVAEDANHGREVLSPQFVSVSLVDGRVFERAVPHTPGSPENPLGQKQRHQKFERCLADGGVPAAPLARALERTATLPSARALLALAVTD